jgi:hypothetical protein
MSGGDWNTSRERKQLAADARELEREQIRLAKRMLRDLRWSAERSTLRKSDWARSAKTPPRLRQGGPHAAMAGTGALLVAVPIMNGGTPCPRHHFPDWLAEINCKNNAQTSVTRPKTPTRKAPGAPRKPRVDAGKPRANYTPRKPKTLS